MQPARIKPHAKEHTNNPVQKPNFRGHAGTMARTRVHKPRQSSRTTRGERTRELVSTWPGAKGAEAGPMKFVINPDPPKNLASTIVKDSGISPAQPHPRSQIPKKPAPQKRSRRWPQLPKIRFRGEFTNG